MSATPRSNAARNGSTRASSSRALPRRTRRGALGGLAAVVRCLPIRVSRRLPLAPQASPGRPQPDRGYLLIIPIIRHGVNRLRAGAARPHLVPAGFYYYNGFAPRKITPRGIVSRRSILARV